MQVKTTAAAAAAAIIIIIIINQLYLTGEITLHVAHL